MFERFTDRARRVLVLAQEEARLLNHNFIGTEHLLLGLMSANRKAWPPRRWRRSGSASKTYAVGSKRRSVRPIAVKCFSSLHATGQEGPGAVVARGPPTRRQLHQHRASTAGFGPRRPRRRRHHPRGAGRRAVRSTSAGIGFARRERSRSNGTTSPSGAFAAHRPGYSSLTSQPTAHCAGCKGGLAEWARYVTLDVPPGDPDSDRNPLRVVFVYCSRCGRALAHCLDRDQGLSPRTATKRLSPRTATKRLAPGPRPRKVVEPGLSLLGGLTSGETYIAGGLHPARVGARAGGSYSPLRDWGQIGPGYRASHGCRYGRN